MFYGSITEFAVRKEYVDFEDGTSMDSDRIFVYTKVKDFEKYHSNEISATIVIVKGVDSNYLSTMLPDVKCIGDVYKAYNHNEKMLIFDIFVDDGDYNNICEMLNMVSADLVCNLQMYTHLHHCYDLREDVALPITSLSMFLNDSDSPHILIGNFS